MFFTNIHVEEFKHCLSTLGINLTDNIAEANVAYIDLEEFIFSNTSPRLTFNNHNFSHRELINRFNRLLQQFALFEKVYPLKKQTRFLSISLQDIQSNYSDQLFRWSFYNHKFVISQGQDFEILDQWNKVEKEISIDEVARFKARREDNLALYLHIIKNYSFFEQIIFSRINPRIKIEVQFGLDIAEESYIEKQIQDNKAYRVCSIVDYRLDDLRLNWLKPFIVDKKFKATILSESKKLNHYHLLNARSAFKYLNIQESAFDNSDFILLINDTENLEELPLINTDKPIFAVDLSNPETPNFGYMLLKDDGFDQIFSFAKKRKEEQVIDTLLRSLVGGLMYFVTSQRPNHQIASNYIDDYLTPLAASLGKTLDDFQGPLELLGNKLN